MAEGRSRRGCSAARTKGERCFSELGFWSSPGPKVFWRGCILQVNCVVPRIRPPPPELSRLYERRALKKSGPDGTLKLSGTAVPSLTTDPSALPPPPPSLGARDPTIPLAPEPQDAAAKSRPGVERPDLPSPPSPLRRPRPQQVQAPPLPTPGACCAFFPECGLQRQSPNFGAGTGDKTGAWIRSRGSAPGAVAQVGGRERRI